MSTIITRAGKGTPLTHAEVDANFTNLNTDKAETAGPTFTGAVKVAVGTAAAPSLAISGDPNTGLYSPGADQVALATAGTGRLFVAANGNVGIGAAPGSYKLDVQGGGQRILNQGTTSFLEIGNGTVTSQTAFIDFTTDTTYTDYGLRLIRDGTGGANGVSQLAQRGTGELSLRCLEAAPITFYTTNTERFRIDTSGRVGIGTTSPGSTLTVNGTARVQNAASFAGINIQNNNDSSVVTTTSFLDASNNLGTIDGHIFFEHLTTGGSNAVISTTPTGDRAADRRVNRLIISAAGTTTLNSATSTAPFIAQIAGAEAVRIDSSGRLLVGTSSAIASFYGTTPTRLYISTTAGCQLVETVGVAHTFGSRIDLYKTRGATSGSAGIVQAGDEFGSFSFGGSDGVGPIPGAAISAIVDGTPGTNDMPGRLVFSTTADGAASPTERMRIKSNGIINFSNAPTHADNTAATAAGLAVGDVYKTVLGVLMIRF